jgi:hypothetical protein
MAAIERDQERIREEDSFHSAPSSGSPGASVPCMDANRPVSQMPLALVASPLLILLPGCRLVGDIFKAGAWVGVIAVLFVLAIVGGIAALFSRGTRG